MLRALVVEDDPVCSASLAELISEQGFKTSSVNSLNHARKSLEGGEVDLAIVDLSLPDGDGMKLIEEYEKRDKTKFLIITGSTDVEKAVDAMRLGAVDYLTKPIDIPRLKNILFGMLQDDTGDELGHIAMRETSKLGDLFAESPPMQRICHLIDRVAPMDATVLIIGESGTGKDLVARTIHEHSRRANKPFVPVNCGAISPSLIESELFGHERGSFTGALSRHHGYFEQADGGTLFLDEVTEMPIELQVKLLRVLESGHITRVGSDKQIAVNVRVLAATNRKPEEAVTQGKMRQDLYYRLNVFPIEMPPLRERLMDIQRLSEFFLEQLNLNYGTKKIFTTDAHARMSEYGWPGNVRELRNIIHRAYILADEKIDNGILEMLMNNQTPMNSSSFTVHVGASIADVEHQLIQTTLRAYDGNKRKAAEVLGISLKTLYNRLNQVAVEA